MHPSLHRALISRGSVRAHVIHELVARCLDGGFADGPQRPVVAVHGVDGLMVGDCVECVVSAKRRWLAPQRRSRRLVHVSPVPLVVFFPKFLAERRAGIVLVRFRDVMPAPTSPRGHDALPRPSHSPEIAKRQIAEDLTVHQVEPPPAVTHVLHVKAVFQIFKEPIVV